MRFPISGYACHRETAGGAGVQSVIALPKPETIWVNHRNSLRVYFRTLLLITLLRRKENMRARFVFRSIAAQTKGGFQHLFVKARFLRSGEYNPAAVQHH